MKTRHLAAGFFLAAAIAASGPLACSFTDSSGKSSDSSKGSSDSSSSSSKSDTARYRDDVEQYTEAFVKAGGRDEGSFFSGLGDLARKRGISDWEADSNTWQAIGRGLGHTDVNEAQQTAYEQAWTGGDAAKLGSVRQGFQETR